MRVYVLRGFLSKYVEELELSPGWHRLPNGVIAYSDPVAIRLADARQSVDGEWRVKDDTHEGQRRHVEAVRKR